MSTDSLAEPQDCFQKRPEWVSRSRTLAAARCLESRLLGAPPHKRGIRWNCQTRDSEKTLAEDTLPTPADGGLSGAARIASSAPRLLECRPEQRLVYVPRPHSWLCRKQVMESLT